MKTVRLGLIGLGQMGKIHFNNCLKMENACLTAVSDLSEKSRNMAKNAGIKNVYSNYVDLFKNPDVDAVIISLPTFLHEKVAVEAAEHGKHVLLEKPIARNSKEAERILSAVKSNGIKLMVGYPLRFNQSFVDLKNKMDLGILGDVQIAIANHISTGPFLSYVTDKGIPKSVPSWWFDKELNGGGALIDLGCHMINLLRFYFGSVKSIHSVLGYRFNMDFEDSATCVVRFNSGTIATLNVGWFSRYHKVSLELHGTTATASESTKSSTWFDYVKRIFKKNQATTFSNELDYFVNCLLSDETPTLSGQEAVEDIKLIEEAYRNTIPV